MLRNLNNNGNSLLAYLIGFFFIVVGLITYYWMINVKSLDREIINVEATILKEMVESPQGGSYSNLIEKVAEDIESVQEKYIKQMEEQQKIINEYEF